MNIVLRFAYDRNNTCCGFIKWIIPYAFRIIGAALSSQMFFRVVSTVTLRTLRTLNKAGVKDIQVNV